MAYETLDSRQVYNGKIFDVYRDTIQLPDSRTAVREYITHEGAAAIVPIGEDGNIIFVRQYRHPARSLVLEIPAGVMEKGEDPLACAKRELEEEIGYKGHLFQPLVKMYSAIGFCTEMLYIYCAMELEQSVQNLDADEFIEIEKYSLQDAIHLIQSGEIIDSKTIAGILAYKEFILKQ